MANLLFNPSTQKSLDDFINSPSHAVIIDGLLGIGKSALALYLTSKILGSEIGDLDNSPQVMHLVPANGSISIEDIRTIQDFVKLKTLGKNDIRRIVVIESAEALTREAQNSLLKLLEEPPSDTVLVLTTSNLTALLPTIRSRSQIIRVRLPTQNAVKEYFSQQGYDNEAINKAYHISQGRVGLMHSILSGESNELLEQIDFAKGVLAMSQFERLGQVDKLAKQKDAIGQFLQALEVVCGAGLSQSGSNASTKLVKRWHKSLSTVVEAQAKLSKQANTKLLITDLMLNL